jgi:NADPH-dependent glutamate synthase beta subunit-like oxidoreductase
MTSKVRVTPTVSVRPLDRAPAGTPMSVSLRSTRDLTTGNWRTFRPQYVTRPSPCNLDCPAGTDVRAFLALSADGDAVAAWRTIREHNPLPGVCGRVCYHPCEKACNRAALDEPVAVHAIERTIADEALGRGATDLPVAGAHLTPVAVVGAGPAGLSAAFHLTRRGYEVTVFDAMPEPGGMLRYGIPAYRLPRAVLDAEIDLLRTMGVRFIGKVRFGENLGGTELADYAASFVAIGAQRSRSAQAPGEDLAGVRSGVDFLREVNMHGGAPTAGPAVVIGGGNTALDTARVLLRLGAEPTIVYRRSREDMPAHPDEIAQAEAEGIAFAFYAAPKAFVGENGRLVRVEFQRMRPGAPDASGRPRPEPVPGSTFAIETGQAYTAIGEEVETELLTGVIDATRGRLSADRFGRTAHRAIFAGGDAATGAGTVVEAIGSGRRAADTIDGYLNGRDPVEEGQAERVGTSDVNLYYFGPAARIRPKMLDRGRAVATFTEVVGDLSWQDAVAEARRCMTCGSCTTCDTCLIFCPDVAVSRDPATGAYQIDLAHCKGCGICVEECPRGAVVLTAEEQR